MAVLIRFSHTYWRAETRALIARMTTDPSKALGDKIDTLLGNLIDDGFLARMDTLYVPLKNETSQAAVLDWKRSAKSAVLNGAATCTTALGFVGSTASGAFIDTDFTPSTDGANLTLNACSYGMYVTRMPSAQKYYFGRLNGTANQAVYMLGDGTGDSACRAHASAGGTASAGSIAVGALTVMQRAASNSWGVYKDGVLVYSDNDTSGALSSLKLFLLAAHNGTTPGTSTGNSDAAIGAWWAGGTFTPAEQLAIASYLDAYAA